ncbi:MAG: MBL fold metallo-hydrolase, partial [Polyangiales bacterium]
MSLSRPRTLEATVDLFPVRTPTLPPATHTNSYALGDREVLLVEPSTPYADEKSAWLRWAADLRALGRTPIGIFLTHHHVDHASAAQPFARALSLPLYAHPETFARVKGLEGIRCEEVLDGHEFVLDGPVRSRWIALHTPGHAPGHLCLHEPARRTLVAGDMVANGSTILVPPDDDGDMAEYLTQLRRLDALKTTTLLPAHGEPIDDPHAVLTYYVKHRLMREAKVLAAHQSLKAKLGREPEILELVPVAYDDTPMTLWPLAKLSL